MKGESQKAFYTRFTTKKHIKSILTNREQNHIKKMEEI